MYLHYSRLPSKKQKILRWHVPVAWNQYLFCWILVSGGFFCEILGFHVFFLKNGAHQKKRQVHLSLPFFTYVFLGNPSILQPRFSGHDTDTLLSLTSIGNPHLADGCVTLPSFLATEISGDGIPTFCKGWHLPTWCQVMPFQKLTWQAGKSSFSIPIGPMYGIFTYMNGWFLWDQLVGKYTVRFMGIRHGSGYGKLEIPCLVGGFNQPILKNIH